MSCAASVTGIILAAGASSRMGSPKALLDYRGETFVRRLARILAHVCDRVIVVLGYHAAAIRESMEASTGPQAEFVINPFPERGQLSSLQTGLAAMPEDTDGFLFIPVDCPAVEAETVRMLAQEFRRREPGVMLVIPQFQGKHGHPVCADGALAGEFLALPAEGQARDVVHGHIAQTRYVNVDDVGILRDADDPEAYRQMIGSTQ